LKSRVWDKLAAKYDRLWVQKYLLGPTRTKIASLLSERFGGRGFALLDAGCATGQLLHEIKNRQEGVLLFGIDKSGEMIRRAKERAPRANLFCADLDSRDLTSYISENSLDAITCCHSFPYYRDKKAVLANLKKVLKDDGVMIFAQASINNMYDRLVMAAVEKTAEPAEYLSRRDFRRLAEAEFSILSEFAVKERFYMPSICGFVLVKRL